ncbi:MAG: TorF family putative porin [Rhodospirillaceae bacterium]|nr:TorF family putative porin [Rhodospirillaceae bacterium]
MKKLYATTTLAAVAALGTPVWAQDAESPYGTIAGSVALTSDYMFRGISQTQSDPAVQGSLTWNSGVGFYAGFWGTNVEFTPGDNADLELDLYAGYAGSVDKFTYDIGVIYYAYPGARNGTDYGYVEGALKVGYDFGPAIWSAGFYYTPDNFAGTEDGVYLTTGLAVPFADSFKIDANIGRAEVNPAFGADYFDWNVGLTVMTPLVDLGVRYHDTDVSTCGNLCDARVVFTLSKSF